MEWYSPVHIIHIGASMKFPYTIPKHYPTADRTDYFTTFDIFRAYNWKRGLIKNWVEQGFIKPLVQVEDKRGKVSYFAGFQLYTIAFFKRLMDIGIPRKEAAAWSRRFENDMLKTGDAANMQVAILRFDNGKLTRISFDPGNEIVFEKLDDDAPDYLILNFGQLVRDVDQRF